jgi:hypothetical protein
MRWIVRSCGQTRPDLSLSFVPANDSHHLASQARASFQDPLRSLVHRYSPYSSSSPLLVSTRPRPGNDTAFPRALGLLLSLASTQLDTTQIELQLDATLQPAPLEILLPSNILRQQQHPHLLNLLRQLPLRPHRPSPHLLLLLSRKRQPPFLPLPPNIFQDRGLVVVVDGREPKPGRGGGGRGLRLVDDAEEGEHERETVGVAVLWRSSLSS